MDLVYATDEEVNLGAMMAGEEVSELPCPTCLSHGRVLLPLREAARAYCMLLAGLRQEDVEELVTYTMLCWECSRFVDRMLHFQEQVLHANVLMRAFVPDQNERENKTFSPLISVIKVGYDCELTYLEQHDDWPDDIHDDFTDPENVNLDLPVIQIKEEVPVESSYKEKRKRTTRQEAPVRKSARKAGRVKLERSPSPPKQRETKRGRKKFLTNTIGSWPGRKGLLKGRKKNVKIVSVNIPEDEMLSFREQDKQSEEFTKYPFRCELCIKGFSFINLLERHNATYHSQDIGPYTCNVCHTVLPTEEQLLRHHKKHYHLYVCTECGYAHRSLPDVFKHYTRMHESGKVFPCQHCDATFPSARKMRYHREITHREVFKCEYCAKVMRNQQSFKSHLLIHTGMPTVECSICHKQCRGDTGLYAHMRTAHNRENAEDAYCAECDIQFKNKAIYRSHLKTSIKHATPAQLKHVCDKCDKKFISETALKQHHRYYHMEYICNVCGKKLNNWYSLDKHVKFVHEGRQLPRKHICETCGKGFKTKRALDSHQMTHTGERPFWCDMCASTFAQKSTLRTHQRLVHFKIKRTPAEAAQQPTESM